MRPSCCMPKMLREDYPECCCATFITIALCHLSSARESPNIRLGHVAHPRVGQQLFDGHLKELERKFAAHQMHWEYYNG